ncbi:MULTISPECIES: hypothetical protein [Arthrobacter]|uniref:Uncharacterized protein n=2 Tax=Arthrobacter TaxID=1663 RepID=A0ABU9KJ82_9MICC|nr:hypothetical protein [Arthrobacter sp. YJM1]MDP5226536.1 hypothetical protein [Arthrobacter sp. YJM1]
MSSRTLITRALTGAAATALLAGAAIAPAQAAPASPTAVEPAVPANCSVVAQGYTAQGIPTTYMYSNNAATAESIKGLKLPSQPQASAYIGAAGDPAFWTNSFYSVAPGGSLGLIKNTANKGSNGKWSYAVTSTPLATGWGSVRGLVFAYPNLYALTADGLTRYDAQNYSAAPKNPVAVAASGWAGVRNLSYSRQTVIGQTSTGTPRYADVLMATDAAGALLEFTIPQDTPTAWTKNVLKPSGFANVTTLKAGYCDTTDPARPVPVLAIDSSGNARVYYDRNSTDGSAADWTGGTVVVAKGWTARAFSN